MAAAGTTSGTEKKKKRDGDTLMHLCLFVCLGDKAKQKMGFCILLCFRVSHPQMHQTLISNDSESTLNSLILTLISNDRTGRHHITS
jgi:hypothetical protein